MKLAGLALATSISGIITFFILFRLLERKLTDFNSGEVGISFVRILLASICMGLVCYAISHRGMPADGTFLSRIVNLGFILFFGGVSYIVFCFIFRVSEMTELWKWVRRPRFK